MFGRLAIPGCVLRNIQYDAAGGAYGAEPGHQTSGGGGRRRVNTADAGGGSDGGPVDLQFQVLQVVIQTQLLQDACRLAGKVRSEQVSVRRETAGASDQLGKRLTRKHGVYARLLEFTFETDKFGALGLRNLDIRLGEDGDHIAGLERQILRSVVVEDKLALD